MATNFSKDSIFDRIKNGFRFWSLYLVKSYSNRVHIGSYKGEDVTPEDTEETKTAKSVNRLEAILSTCPNNAPLSIDLRQTVTANGTGVVGPLEFINGETAQPETVNTFTSLGAVPAGYISQNELEGRLLKLEADSQKRFNEYVNKTERDKFDRYKTEETQKLDDLRKELNEEKKKYDSNVAKTADVLLMAGQKLLGAILPQFVGNTQTAAPLSGAQPQQIATEQPATEPDAKSDAANDVAEFLYNNFSVDEIKKLNEALKLKKNGIPENRPQQAASEPDDTDEQQF